MLSTQRGDELARLRIDCDDAFARVVDSSRTSFRDTVTKSYDQLETLSEREICGIRTLRDKVLSNHHVRLGQQHDEDAERVSSTITAARGKWETEDLNREDLPGKIRQLKRNLLSVRRLKESKRRELKAKRSEVHEQNTNLVNDMIQIQNRFMRLVDKSRSFAKESEDHYMRILTSNRAELVETVSTLWHSYISLTRKLKSVDSDDELRGLFDQVSSKDHMINAEDPFYDILELNRRLMNKITCIHAELTEKLQKLSHRKKFS